MASELAPLAGAIATVLDRLHESFRQQRDFTSDAAHELKTSVAILKSTLQSLLQKPRAGQEYRAGLEDSLQDCERLEDLLERMLRLARIEEWAGAGTPRDVGSAELATTCEAAIARIERMAAARNVRLELANSAASVNLRADPKDLELIWVNLLENAVQYSPSGSSVVLRTARNGAETVVVSVEDCGPGVSPAELPHIFERFRRGDPSRARATGGFGLGLAICKALVEAYGGRIEAANRTPQGAVVRVELPAELEASEVSAS
jgi:signal transduction histidine kinase